MTSVEIQREIKLIDASKKIAAIYLQYNQIKATQAELTSLGRTLAALPKEQDGRPA